MKPTLRLHLKKIEANGAALFLVCRNEEGSRYTVQVNDFSPYFFVDATEVQTVKKKGMKSEPGLPAIDGTQTLKVYVDTPMGVSKRRKGFKRHFEADVPYPRRFLVDTGIHDGFEVSDYMQVGNSPMLIASWKALKPVVGYRNKDRAFQYDIETNKPEGSKHYSPPVEAAGAITALTFQDNFDGERFHTHYWHPTRGTVGRPKMEIRNQWSDGFQKDVEWRIYTYGSEEEFLIAILQYLKTNRPDVMQAWNGHHGHHRRNFGGFDAPYIINRLRRIGIAPGQLSPFGTAFAGWKVFGKETDTTNGGRFQCSIDGVQLVDSMTVHQIKEGGFTAQVPFSDLKRVTEKYTEIARPGRGKKMKKYPGQIESMWLHDSEAFLIYSFHDVDALIDLESSEAYLEWAREMQQFVGVDDTNKIFAPMALITTMILRIAKEQGVCLPTADSDRDDYEAEGGYVMDPRVKGIQRRVGVLDLSTMYVNIIISGNISPETHVPNPTEEQEKDLICVPSDLGPQFFLKPSVKEGLLPKACKRFVAMRQKYDVLIKASTSAEEIKKLKHKRQPAKQLVLGVWGTSLSPFFTLFKPECGSSITGTGRYVIKSIDDETTELGDQMVYGDSDSSFIPLPEDDPVGHGRWLEERFAALFDRIARAMNMDTHSFKIGLELIYDPFVMGETKKMYCGNIIFQEGKWQDPPVFAATGISGIKSDAAPITKEASESVLKAILSGVPPLEILDYVRMLHEGVLNGDVPVDQVIKAVALNDDIDNPKANVTNVVRGARYGKSTYDYEYPVGAKVRVIKMKGGDAEWLAIPDGEALPPDAPLDLDHHARLAILNPLESLLDWIDVSIDSVKHGTIATVQRRL